MTSTTSNESVNLDLSQAIKQWNDYAADSAKDMTVLLHAATPIKDFVQVTEQVGKVMKETDWVATGKKLMDAKAVSEVWQEFMEIQLATVMAMRGGTDQLLKTTQGSGKLLSTATKDISSPQRALAAYLQVSLGFLKQCQANATEQAEKLNAIRAAYNAWFGSLALTKD
jgi:hypothetical protein